MEGTKNIIVFTENGQRKINARSLANLKPFKPGQSGNPKGGKTGSISITAAIRERLNKFYPEKSAKIDGKIAKKIRKTYLQKIVETMFDNAIASKDQRALAQIHAYIDGHPKATLDVGVDKTELEALTKFFRIAAKPKKEQ